MAGTLTKDKREISNNLKLRDYDRLVRAQAIIRNAYYKKHSRTYRPMGKLPRRKDGKPLYSGPGPRDGILACGLPITHDEVRIRIGADGREYHDHKSCDSWACPICARKMANKRADEIRQALVGANKKGYQCLFLTFTVPHRKSHSSAYVLKVLDTCYNKLIQSRKIRDMKQDYGFIGQIKCKDYTVGDNGLHAHLHCIWVFDGSVDLFPAEVLAALNAIVMDKWDRLVNNETGKHINRKHGFDMEYIELGSPDAPDAERVAHYAAKSISVYMADGADKEKGSKTPFDFLDSTATEEEKAMYLDFYKGQKGKRHIVFSRGLKEHLGVSKPEYEPPASAIVAWIGYEDAYLLRDEAKRQEFERIASGSVEVALKWLDEETQRQQDDLRCRFYGAPATSGHKDALLLVNDYIVPHEPAIKVLDAPERDLKEAIEDCRHLQEDVFPDLMRQWRDYRWLLEHRSFRSFEDRREYIDNMLLDGSEPNGLKRW